MTTISGNMNRGGRKLRVRGKFKQTSGMNRKEKHEFDQNKEIIQIKKNIKEIKGETELKYFDVSISGTLSAAGTLFVLNAMAVGDTQITRTAGQIKMTSLQFRLKFLTNPARINASGVRVIVFWDRQVNGANPTISGAPLTPVNAVLNDNIETDLTMAPYQYEQIERFHVLYDRMFEMNPQVVATQDIVTTGDTTAVVRVSSVLSKYIKLNRSAKYSAAASGVASLVTNALYMLIITDLASSQPTVDGCTRIYFRDA